MGQKRGFVETTDPGELAAYKAYLFSKIKIDQGGGKMVDYKPSWYQMLIHFPESSFEMPDGSIHEPEPPWRYLCNSSGRRTGKTLDAALEILYELGLPRRRVWIVAPNYELTDRVFDYVYDWVVRQQVFGPKAWVKASKTKDQRYIEMAWASFVKGKSADSPDSLVGDQLDLIVFDECARCVEKIWIENLEPTTIDRKGRAIFPSTPRGYNWFEKYFERGFAKDTIDKGWRSIQVRTVDNPHQDEKWVLSKKSETPKDVWEQEYEGKFTTRSGLIWPEYENSIYPAGHLFNPDDYDFADGSYTVYRAIDIGTRHPTACLWGAVDPEDNLFVFREYQAQNVIHEAHADAIAALTVEKVATTFISPDAARRSMLTNSAQDRLCALDIYRRAGIYAQPASNNVNAGISEVARYFRATLEDHPSHPKVFISKELLQLTAGLRSYVFHELKSASDVDAPDKPRKYQDDLMDAFRYLMASTPRYHAFWMEDEVYTESAPERRRVTGAATVPYYG